MIGEVTRLMDSMLGVSNKCKQQPSRRCNNSTSMVALIWVSYEMLVLLHHQRGLIALRGRTTPTLTENLPSPEQVISSSTLLPIPIEKKYDYMSSTMIT